MEGRLAEHESHSLASYKAKVTVGLRKSDDKATPMSSGDDDVRCSGADSVYQHRTTKTLRQLSKLVTKREIRTDCYIEIQEGSNQYKARDSEESRASLATGGAVRCASCSCWIKRAKIGVRCCRWGKMRVWSHCQPLPSDQALSPMSASHAPVRPRKVHHDDSHTPLKHRTP